MPAVESASTEGAVCTVSETVQTPRGQLKIVGGIEPHRAWVIAEHHGLQVRKFTAKGGASVVELKYGGDAVVLSLSQGRGTVSRGGRTLAIGTPEAVDEIRELIGASPAVFHARLLLSKYEQTSDLKGPSMSVLSALALVAVLTGDVDAPARLTERFLEKHRGILRRVIDDASCYKAYESEVNEAWKDYEACLKEALQGAWWLATSRAQLCTIGWTLRSESAWFELLKCNGVTAFLPKIE